MDNKVMAGKMMETATAEETEKEAIEKEAIEKEVTDNKEVSEEAVKAVEAMKAALSHQEDESAVYITSTMEWRKALKSLEEEVEKELEHYNSVIGDIISKEKAKCKEALHKEYAEKEKALIKQQEEEIAKLKEEQAAELEKMKKLYAEQLDEAGEAFREKAAALRKEIDQHKEQIEVLMLHIDDPFVLQEMQMKQTQETEKTTEKE